MAYATKARQANNATMPAPHLRTFQSLSLSDGLLYRGVPGGGLLSYWGSFIRWPHVGEKSLYASSQRG